MIIGLGPAAMIKIDHRPAVRSCKCYAYASSDPIVHSRLGCPLKCLARNAPGYSRTPIISWAEIQPPFRAELGIT